MALDRGTPEGVEAWLAEASTKPWSFPTTVGPELSQEILQHIYNHWDTYTPNIKLGKTVGEQDEGRVISEQEDEWVVLISKMLRDYPNTSALDLNIEQHIPPAAQNGLQNLMNKTILNNMSVPPSPGLTSPVNATGFNFPPAGPSQIPIHGPPSRSNSMSSGQSLFIPSKRRSSQLTQPYPKVGASQGSESPTEPKVVTITQGKKYQKPSRIQMIDISTGSKIIKDQEESKRQTQLEEQQSKEARRLEREKKQEEKRREEEEKRQQKEQEKAERAEKQRLKEEAKRRRSEKTERKTTTKVNTTTETEITDAQANTYPGDEVVEEETVSDGEMSHKNPQTIVASPTSLSPPANQFNDQYIDNSTINTSFMHETSTEAEPSRQPMTSDVTPVQQPMQLQPASQQFEEQPRRNMSPSERLLFERNCVAVLTEANKVNDNAYLRQIIINFLGGVHGNYDYFGIINTNELKAASVGILNSDDPVRQIILHEETARNHDGKATTETLIFEINLNNGQWRKLKRKKVKEPGGRMVVLKTSDSDKVPPLVPDIPDTRDPVRPDLATDVELTTFRTD
ncbi:7070_t:CDS:10, partial [Racocetra fulgida]